MPKPTDPVDELLTSLTEAKAQAKLAYEFGPSSYAFRTYTAVAKALAVLTKELEALQKEAA